MEYLKVYQNQDEYDDAFASGTLPRPRVVIISDKKHVLYKQRVKQNLVFIDAVAETYLCDEKGAYIKLS